MRLLLVVVLLAVTACASIGENKQAQICVDKAQAERAWGFAKQTYTILMVPRLRECSGKTTQKCQELFALDQQAQKFKLQLEFAAENQNVNDIDWAAVMAVLAQVALKAAL